MRAGDLLHTVTVSRVEIDQRKTGENAQDLRIALGLTYRGCAKALGISAPYLNDLEKGRRNFASKEGKRYLAFLASKGARP